MKTLAITGVVAAVGVFALTQMDFGTVVVSNPEVVVQEKEVEVDALDAAIKSAQEAQKDAIESVAQKAHDEAYNQEMKKVELEVIKSFNEQLDARQIELEKETKVY